jgi:hypothetical protein
MYVRRYPAELFNTFNHAQEGPPMVTRGDSLKLPRRQFLQATAAAAASWGVSSSASGQVCPSKAGTVRDKVWIFSNPTNADFDVLRKRSVMSPFEAAVYMGIPNIFMVQQYPGAKHQEMYRKIGYRPFEPPFEQYTIPLSALKRFAWSVTGAGGVTYDWERRQVLAMAPKIPNMVGVYLDDFFHGRRSTEIASLTLDQLRDIQRQIKGPDKKMDMYVTFYSEGLELPVAEYLRLIDVITFWIRKPEDLADEDSCLTKLEKLVPHSRKMLGVDTCAIDRTKTPPWTNLSIPLMQKRCQQALGWLRSGRIEGIVIYGGTTIDLGFESVEWTREWIQKVGDTKL